MSGKRLITFSLWGRNPKYTVGAVKNALLAPEIYPGWICRFFVSDDAPAEVVDRLRGLPHVEVVIRDDASDWRGSVWRFLPAAEADVDVMISRDTDSRLNLRERAAVDEWLAGEKQFHIMRDHPFHSRWPVLAGMWGVRGDALRAIPELLGNQFYGDAREYAWGVDQVFLASVVHPLIRQSALVHDEISPLLPFDSDSERRPFPTRREGTDFVGQVFDARDRAMARYAEVLMQHLKRRQT